MIFGYPDMGRYGLGHGLSAWARCVVWCHQEGARMVAPQWFKLRVGPYLRRERDKRNYFLLFHSSGYVSGPRRWGLLAGARRVIAGPDLRVAGLASGTVVTFKNALADNEKKHFHEFRDHHALLRAEIWRITRLRYRPLPFEAPTIAVHVRMGDFGAPANEEELKAGQNNRQIPLAWYVETVEKVRKAVGWTAPVVVFSDGSDAALEAILRLPNVRRSPPQQSITDMLSISQAQLLIASGSGFSVWGRFFGQVPTICFPGQMVVRAVVAVPEVECGPGDAMPSDMTSSLKRAFLPPPAHGRP